MEPTTPATPNDATPNDATPTLPQEDKTNADKEPSKKFQAILDKRKRGDLDYLYRATIAFYEESGIPEESVAVLREMTLDDFGVYIQNNPGVIALVYGEYTDEYFDARAREYTDLRDGIVSWFRNATERKTGGTPMDMASLLPAVDVSVEELNRRFPYCDFRDIDVRFRLDMYLTAMLELATEFKFYLDPMRTGGFPLDFPAMTPDEVFAFLNAQENASTQRDRLFTICQLKNEMAYLKWSIENTKSVEDHQAFSEQEIERKDKQIKDLTFAKANQQETIASQQETIASLTRSIASLQKQADETLPQIQQTMTDGFKKARDAGRRAKDEILIEIAARVKGRSGAGNGVKGMTVKNFVALFRDLFLKWSDRYRINPMPYGDKEGCTTHDPIENNLRKILDTEKDGEKRRYVPYQKKNKRKPFYWEIYDLTEALSTHCMDRGYTYKDDERCEHPGIGKFIDDILSEAEMSDDKVDLNCGDYIRRESAVQDETDDGDDEE